MLYMISKYTDKYNIDWCYHIKADISLSAFVLSISKKFGFNERIAETDGAIYIYIFLYYLWR